MANYVNNPNFLQQIAKTVIEESSKPKTWQHRVGEATVAVGGAALILKGAKAIKNKINQKKAKKK